jgi:hypothetical protein
MLRFPTSYIAMARRAGWCAIFAAQSDELRGAGSSTWRDSCSTSWVKEKLVKRNIHGCVINYVA